MKCKTLFATIAAAAITMIAPGISAQTVVPSTPIPFQGGVGPVISGTVTANQLPQKAQEFLSRYFPETAVKNIEEEFSSQTFEVDLTDGTDLEFYGTGEWKEIDAPDKTCLPASLVQQLVPQLAYSNLTRLGYTASVESVKRTRDTYEVDLRGSELDDICFDVNGVITAIGM